MKHLLPDRTDKTNMNHRPLLALLACSSMIASCGGGIRVYESESGIPGPDNPLRGVPFHRRVPATKTTEWLTTNGKALWTISEPTTMVDRSRTFVVEGFNDSWNPFDNLEFTAKLGDDDTLSEVAYKSDPQLASSLKSAGDAKGAGLFGGVDDAMSPPDSVIDQTDKVVITVTPD